MSAPRIIRTGRDHTWTAPMSDMQREKAEAPFADGAPLRGFLFSALPSLLLWAVIGGLAWFMWALVP